MLVVMKHGASEAQVRDVVEVIENLGYDARAMPGRQRTTVGLMGNDGRVDSSRIQGLAGVLEIILVTKPYKQVSREWREADTTVEVGKGVIFGGSSVPVIAGPCSVESESQIMDVAHLLKESGASLLRGGAFKPRTSPYSWQGMGEKGLELLARAREATGLGIVTEVMDRENVGLVSQFADIVQIGTRNMQNYPLLRKIGQCGKPVLLKRGMSATITELLLAAEYLFAEGNQQVILCERGIRSFDNNTRNLLDLSAIPVVKGLSHLPIIADPSHGTGVRDKVTPMARAAVAAGADGLMIEVHPNPAEALSDGAQSLYPDQFSVLMREIQAIGKAIGRKVGA
ncbi:MAG: 3-deoxy-7-phosphoheptulonate synthase [bacterium]|jgi:3-deoxy-7-phosphoheptulonate synthase